MFKNALRSFQKKKNPRKRIFKNMTERVSRVLSRTIIYLRCVLPHTLPAVGQVAAACQAFALVGQTVWARGVASDRVYMAPRVTTGSVSSYLAFPSLPCRGTAVYFCCTFPEVTFGGRYPLSCPVKPGLSS